jgi:hypothetical protein
MSRTTDSLITSLADTMEPVKPAAHPAILFMQWVLASLVYVAILLFFFGLRTDLFIALYSPPFVAEIGLLLCMVITCGMSAMALSFPDLHQKRWMLLAPVVPLVLFVAMMIVGWMQEAPSTPQPLHAIECLLCIILYALLPAFWMMVLLRKQASTHQGWAGGVALLAAFSMGCFALRLSEDTDSIRHLVTWHYLPMAGFALIGVALGKKRLKW